MTAPTDVTAEGAPPPTPAATTAAAAKLDPPQVSPSSTAPVPPPSTPPPRALDRVPNPTPPPGSAVHPIDAPPHDSALHLDEDAPGSPTSGGKGGGLGQRLLIAGIVAAVIAGWFVVLAWVTGDDPGTDSGRATATTAATGGTGTSPVAGGGTTIPGADPGDMAPGSATTTPPDATAIPAPTVAGPFTAVGDPIPIPELALGAFAVGPIDFGDEDGFGRLVASLDQPDAVTLIDDGSLGLCLGEPGFAAVWGPFTALFTGTPEDGELAGYRLAARPGGHPTAALTTLSGLQVGETVADLESVYATFTIGYEQIDGVPGFILVRSDGATLLWGPVTSAEADGSVDGIYSPRPCDAGPALSG
ncbi:MAG: hypothetical protein H0V96_10405 [Acidimicrobiia bacterium]|nr:hypothetical protein [Acidimicrobiia bacterium]